jgi:hypothetical protein
MYKNADKYLRDSKKNTSKRSMVDTVSKSRIDRNARKVQSMLHFVIPSHHTEVHVPANDSEESW